MSFPRFEGPAPRRSEWSTKYFVCQMKREYLSTFARVPRIIRCLADSHS
jgi:hypothetical protein